ncbi:hypothetical protein [Sedimentitalea sp.]|uniref:hypothetical protein n=1 Tax=Sedimentitalea sp. TaxID=2048915 RepID=UPI0032992155
MSLEPKLKTGNVVFLAGFPAHDSRMPPEFMNLLLGQNRKRTKRIMPGRIVAPPATASGTSILRGGLIVADASTSEGTAGAPLIDLHSGQLVGLNFSGQWNNPTDGKFAYSRPISALLATDRIRSYIRTDPSDITLDGITWQIDDLRERSEALVRSLAKDVTVLDQTTEDLVLSTADIYSGRSGYDPDFLNTKLPLPNAKFPASQISFVLTYEHFSIQMNTERQLAFFAP